MNVKKFLIGVVGVFIILSLAYYYADGFFQQVQDSYKLNQFANKMLKSVEDTKSVCAPILAEHANFPLFEEKIASCLASAPSTFVFSGTVIVEDGEYVLKSLKNAGLFSAENIFKQCLDQAASRLPKPIDISIKVSTSTWRQENKMEFVRQNNGRIKKFSETTCVSNPADNMVIENEEPIQGLHFVNEKLQDNKIQKSLVACDVFLPPDLNEQSIVASLQTTSAAQEETNKSYESCVVKSLIPVNLSLYESCLCTAMFNVDQAMPKFFSNGIEIDGAQTKPALERRRNNWLARIVSNQQAVYYLLDKHTEENF